METTIASLEEELAAASREREEALSRNENLASELEALSERLSKSSTELNILQEEVSGLVSFLLISLCFNWFYEFYCGNCKVRNISASALNKVKDANSSPLGGGGVCVVGSIRAV